MTELYTPSQAAVLINVNKRTVRRLIEKGWLDAKLDNGVYSIRQDALRLFVQKTKARKILGNNAEEVYVLNRHGARKDVCVEISNLSPSVVELAVQRYEEERQLAFQALGLKGNGEFLLGKEVAARLKIRDYHVIDRLLGEGFIKGKELFNGRKKFVIYDESFKEYLGKDLHNRFLTSRDVAASTGLSVHRIDKLALRNKFGRKILGTKNSHYLFNPEAVAALESLALDIKTN